MGGFLSGIGSLASKVAGGLNSPTGKGITDLTGRAGNAMATAGGNPQGATYDPRQEGLGGIRQDVNDISRPPMQVAPEIGVPVGALPSRFSPPRIPMPARAMPSFSPVNPLIPAGGANGPSSY